MTRKEEIEKASVEYQLENKPIAIGGDFFDEEVYRMNVNPSFIAGARWADAHPIHYDGKAYLYVLHKGVEQGKKEMLDKVCEWLKENGTHYWWDEEDDDGLNDLRKAMEERL